MSDVRSPYDQPSAAGSAVPAATRTRTPGWRDPRLWIGIALVAACVVAGSVVLGSADETEPVWAVRADVAPGDAVGPDDVVAVRVRFGSGAEEDRYLPAAEPPPDGARALRAVAAGELLPRAALGSGAESAGVRVPLAVDPTRLPDQVAAGDVVDVYVTSESAAAGGDGAGDSSGGPAGGAVLLLRAVAVSSLGDPAAGLGAGGEQRLVVTVGEEQADQVPTVLGRAATGVLTVVARG